VDRSALFAGFAGTIDESDFFVPFIIGYGLRPSRCGPGDGFPGRPAGTWLRQISQKTAEAASEGGGLFGGGVQVSDAEKATLGEISTALGI